jgi:CubicO group peptidase (beta-lactamase class C family)
MRAGLVRKAAVALSLFLGGCAPRPAVRFAETPASFPPDIEARIQRVEARARLPERMAELRVPGVSIAVVNRGIVEWARGYGVREANTREPVNQDTLFQAASLSKPVTSMAVMRLVQDGRLFLDEDVNVRLRGWHLPPSPAARGLPVTLRLLLSHSAGVSVHGFRGYAAGERVPSLLDVLDGRPPCNSPPIRVELPPGEAPRYSGGGFVIVQQLVGDVVGARFEDVMASMVLAPLGMLHSTFAQPLPDAYGPYAAAGHRDTGQEISGRWFTHPEMAAAGLWTTPTDLSRFIIELQAAYTGRQSRLLAQATARQMLTLQRGSAGLGIMVQGRGAALRFEHGGSNQGFRAAMVGAAYGGQGAVVMANSDAASPILSEVVRAIEEEYGWSEHAGRRRRVEVDPREGDPGSERIAWVE